MYARELIIDGFAGGGGASEGITLALGRGPDIAYNHDPEAVAMHRANHPETRHVCQNIMRVDPLAEVGHQPVGLAWFSPDCKHHSKAKGGKPVKRAIRDLAWVVVLWAKRARPRIILLENVEEFRDWGPLIEREPGQFYPDPARRGQTFERWVAELRRLGYRVEWRELRACDFGAPTIRKRLYLIARRDGLPIVWPKPTHAPLGDGKAAAFAAWAKAHSLSLGAAHALKPYRTAAGIIDWSLPCHSIFLSREEGRALGVNRPLADNTMARVAKGVTRYVLESAAPFIVPLTHQGGERGQALSVPLATVTGANRGEQALVAPVVTYAQQGGGTRAAEAPLHTITASTKDQNAIIAPYLIRTAHGEADAKGKRRGRGAQELSEPAPTVCASRDAAVAVPFLVPRYGERTGQEPRTRAIDEPAPVVVPTANGGSLAAVMLSRQFGNSVGSGADEPIGTTTAGGGGKTALVAAFMAQHNTGVVGHAASEPVSTLSTTGSHQQVVSAGLLSLKGSERRLRDVADPAATVLAGGTHAAEVRAFLTKYYGPNVGQSVGEPVHTATTKARFGLVTVQVGGEPYVVVDIGMRMLSPRELFRAQGFGDHYVIDRGVDEHGETIPLTKTAQVRMCGNSVCPDVAKALVAANYRPLHADQPVPLKRQPAAQAPLPLFAAE